VQITPVVSQYFFIIGQMCITLSNQQPYALTDLNASSRNVFWNFVSY